MRTPIPPSERFWRKVTKTDGCWLWTGKKMGRGGAYGSFRPGTRTTDPSIPAHRFAYEDQVGPIPPGMELDHLCRVTHCVRPSHLEPVTHAENRRRSRLATCRAGLHDLTDPANVRWDNDGNRRGCLACHRQRAQERAARTKG